jgi:hypothetical protein
MIIISMTKGKNKEIKNIRFVYLLQNSNIFKMWNNIYNIHCTFSIKRILITSLIYISFLPIKKNKKYEAKIK